jgi:O-antigen biosynthesis protein
MPFDQFQRYKLVSEIINKYRTGERKFKVLDVGAGFEETLKKFLPLDEISCLDIQYPAEYSHKENFITGDILRMEFKEKYDFVVAVDIYEHIIPSERKKFIDIIIPLSEIATIIAAPFDQDDVKKSEAQANEVYRSSHGCDHIWLKEHQENGLPSLPDTLNLIKKQNFNTVTLPNGYLPRWFEMISVYLLTEGKPEFQPLMQSLNEFYNLYYYTYDNRNPAYRQAVVILKGESIPDLSDLIARDFDIDELTSRDLVLKSLMENIKKSYQIHTDEQRRNIEITTAQDKKVTALERVSSEKDSQINLLSAKVQTLNQETSEKDSQINLLSVKVQTLEQDTSTKDTQINLLSVKVQTLEQDTSTKDTQINLLSAKIQTLEQDTSAKDSQINLLSTQIRSLEKNLATYNQELNTARTRINSLNQIIKAKESEIILHNERANHLVDEIESLKSSASYQIFAKFQKKIIDPLFPQGTRRREVYDFGLKGCRVTVSQGLGKAWEGYKRYHSSQKKIPNTPQELPHEPVPEIKTANHSDSPDVQTTVFRHNQNMQELTEYIPLSQEPVFLTENDLKCIAFYLPQFHPIPENDRWWGKGFTEWTNVTKALPQFINHYQPHLPDELGFYDLRVPEIQKRQIDLARHYGIYGFCFHYYWFNGKRLLELPLNQFLENKETDFPFCICWANENWTRRWDGLEHEVLISQTHSPENDIHFIRDIEHILRDSRYIRIDGKPLLLVYRAALLPDAKETTRRWREYCKDAGIGDICLVAALAFGCDDPTKYGFDAAVEFPPHSMSDCNIITEKKHMLNSHFSGCIYDYADFVTSQKYQKNYPYRCFRTVSPGWDNTARRPNNASIFFGANPALYKEWLFNVAKSTKETHPLDEQIVFINAWNEWAEGTHLEPDRKFGYGYLQATADVIREIRDPSGSQKKKIIIVSHDAHLHGAQMLALHITKVLREQFHYEVHLLLKSGGILEEEFRKYAVVYNLEKEYWDPEAINNLLISLSRKGISIAICNTVVTGDIVELLAKQQIRTLSLVHELPGVIRQLGQEENAKKIARFADRVIFPAEVVKEKFSESTAIDTAKCTILPQGLFLKNKYKDDRDTARIQLRKILSLPTDSKIILNVGYGDPRKGVDLFVEVACRVLKEHTDVWFVWVGLRDEPFMQSILTEIERTGLTDRILFPGIRRDIDIFYSGADIFLLTSREDPFPSVVLDAMNTRLPVIGFDNAGGFKDIISETTGMLVPYLSVDRMADAVSQVLKDPGLQIRLGNNAADLIEREFNFPDYIYTLLRFLGHDYKKISVILPSYNYEGYLPERIGSIFSQTYPVYEIIAIDDNSKDRSAEVLRRSAELAPVPFKVIVNPENSGSVFRQWAKGIALARGDYVWIAEADDLSDSRFLEEVMKGFRDESVVLSYSQSRQIDESGTMLAQNYYDYTNEVDPDKWKRDYSRPGTEEIRDSLAIKNTIPNVSAVVFIKTDISGIVEDLVRYKVAGDWFFYIWVLKTGSIYYHAQSLNLHRRHKKSVTTSENAHQHFNEIVTVQDFVIANFTVDTDIREKIRLYREHVHNYLLK